MKKKFYKQATYFSIVIALLASFLLVGRGLLGTPDLGWTILWFAILAGNLYIILEQKQVQIGKWEMLLIASYLIVTLGYQSNTRAHTGNVMLNFILLIVLNLSLAAPSIWQHPVIRATYGGALYMKHKIAGLIMYGLEMKNLTDSDIGISGKVLRKAKRFMQISLIFLLIGVPVICFALTLLAASSDVFGEWVWSLLDIDFSMLILRVFVFGAFFSYLVTEFSFFWESKESQEEIESTNSPLNVSWRENLGYALLLTLVILNVFYVLFIVAQLQYDLGNLQALIAEQGADSFSEVAVGRFWELVIVVLVNLGLLYFSRRLNIFSSNIVTKFADVNVAVVGINTLLLVFSALQRLNLYISGYGFTHRRLTAYMFLPIVIFMVVLVLLGYFYYKKVSVDLVAKGLVGSFLVFLSVMSFLPLTYLTNKVNHELYLAGSIQTFDPIYSVDYVDATDRVDFRASGVRDELAGYRNDVTDYDGLWMAQTFLDDDRIELTELERAILIERISDFKSENIDQDLREFNLATALLKAGLN